MPHIDNWHLHLAWEKHWPQLVHGSFLWEGEPLDPEWCAASSRMRSSSVSATGAGAGAGSPAGVRSRAAWAVSRCFFVFFAFFCFFLAFFAAFRSFRSFSSADDAESSSDGIALGQ